MTTNRLFLKAIRAFNSTAFWKFCYQGMLKNCQDIFSVKKFSCTRPATRALPSLTKEEWVSVLKLATIWQMEEVSAKRISCWVQS